MLYQARTVGAFNKTVKPRDLRKDDMVLKENRGPIYDQKEKFKPN